MKKNKLTLLAFAFAAFTSAYAQSAQGAYPLNGVKEFVQSLSTKNTTAPKVINMPLAAGKTIEVKLIEDQSEGNQLNIYGEVIGAKSSVFYIYGNPDNVKGKIILDNKEGFEISTDEQTKQVVVKSVDINTLICVMPSNGNTVSTPAETSNENASNKTTAQAAFSSNPSAPFVLYLDFDGEYVNDSYWNSQMGGAKQCNGPNYADSKVKSIWAGIAEKYRPYNINVTTDRAVFDGKSKAMRHMVVYTNSWGSGGGIADIGSIANNGTDICWVFYANLVNDVNDMVVTGAHESGHAFGLQHDGTSSTNYYGGQGNWGPIMGNNYQTANRDIWQWSKGEYNGATHHGGTTNYQDDVKIIADNPGVGYRTDEDANTTASAREITPETDGTVLATKNNGIITTRTDKDYFKFTTNGGTVNFKFQSSDKIWTTDEAVLDIQARLLDANGTELQLSNPLASGSDYGVNATISKTGLAAGVYYLEVDGVGYLNPATTGYSDYASIGYYEISGSYAPLFTGLDNKDQADGSFSVYPNPAADRLFVAFANPTSQVSYAKVIDALGRTVGMYSSSQLQQGIDISNLTAGVYLIQVSDASTQILTTKRFIKE